MEMEMRAMEDIEMAEDITPPLSPITSALHDSFLLTHCSSCFSPLSNFPCFHGDSLRYCSTKCYNFDSATAHFFSTHHLPFSETADLRASFRLLHLLRSNPSAWLSGPPERVFGLLTNREKLMSSSREEFGEDYNEPFVRIRKGAEAMAFARRADFRHENVLEEAVLCLVLTNAVEVLSSDGRSIGIAVYDPSFSWINHSCSPNACYRFLPTETTSHSMEIQTMLRVVPRCSDIEAGEGSAQIKSTVQSNLSDFVTNDLQDYGPRIIVRSIKGIRKGEAVTITYCDLLQPKAMRQSELWSRYQFACCCQRCSVEPLAYVDHALLEISAAKVDLLGLTSVHNFCHDNAVRRINDYVDEVITEYLSVGSPESCCEKLETMLTSGFCVEEVGQGEGKQLHNLRLQPLHHLSLNAYTALASAYKVRSSDVSASYSNIDELQCDAVAMSRTSAAYSLLLAGATHHLFLSEPSLIASAANCWVAAGESLINLSRSSSWIDISQWSFHTPNLYPDEKRMCSKCSWIGKFSASRNHSQALGFEFQEFSNEFFNCVSDISQKTWSFLAHGCHYLKAFKDPFDFSWPKTMTSSKNQDSEAHSTNLLGSYSETENTVSPQGYFGQERASAFQLGIHCLFYGGYLGSICYGHHSHLASQILSILDEMN